MGDIIIIDPKKLDVDFEDITASDRLETIIRLFGEHA